MPGLTESGITLTFPDHRFFRFQDCKGYQNLSGYHFKEMDVCWFEAANNCLWLIELKDFSGSSSPITVKDRASELTKKAVDSLCMLLSDKHRYAYAAANIDPCFVDFPPKPGCSFKFINIIRSNSAQKSDVQLLHDQFRNQFRPYASLFEISYFAVITHDQAQRIYPGMVS